MEYLPNINESGNSYRGYVIKYIYKDAEGIIQEKWGRVHKIEEGVGCTITKLNDVDDRLICLKKLPNTALSDRNWNKVVNIIKARIYDATLYETDGTSVNNIPASKCAFAM